MTLTGREEEIQKKKSKASLAKDHRRPGGWLETLTFQTEARFKVSSIMPEPKSNFSCRVTGGKLDSQERNASTEIRGVSFNP